MEAVCIRHTELPGATRLFTDYLYQFDRVASFYRHDPSDPDALRRVAASLDYPLPRREQLVAALREQNGDSAALALLAQPGAGVVVTGQQVGLLSGPAYTLYKALTAVRVAEELKRDGIPAVPVFWLASEDHDLDEVRQCWLFNGDLQPSKIELPGATTSQRPVGGIPIPRLPVEEIAAALRDLPFADEVVDLVRQAYPDGVTYAAGFHSLLARLLSSFGILFLDPMHPSIRALAAPVLADAVGRSGELMRALNARDQELAAAGYHRQVHLDPHLSLVFLLENGRRLHLRRDGDQYTEGGRRFSAAELAAQAERLSPNALLRPVVQDAILPTIAYVGGPAELAYLAQSAVLYDALLGRAPVFLHRQGFTLLDFRADKLMSRYRLSLSDAFHGEDALREKIAARLIPAALAADIETLKKATTKPLDCLRGDLLEFDPTLAAALDNSRRKIEYQITKIERKVGREALRRDERAVAETAFLYSLLYPHRHLQERFYSILPFLAKHGLSLVDTIAENVNARCADHVLLSI